jgi:hypothetical protein
MQKQSSIGPSRIDPNLASHRSTPGSSLGKGQVSTRFRHSSAPCWMTAKGQRRAVLTRDPIGSSAPKAAVRGTARNHAIYSNRWHCHRNGARAGGPAGWASRMDQVSYRRHRFPPPIIQHAIWLYLRFILSYRDMEELLAERGVGGFLRNRGALGFKVRARDRTKAPTLPPAPERPMAPRRDGGSHRRQADVPVARCRSRGRGSRYAGSAPPRQARGTPADAQAP